RRAHDLLDRLSAERADTGSHHLVRPSRSVGRDRNDGGQCKETRADRQPDTHEGSIAAAAPQGDSKKWDAPAPRPFSAGRNGPHGAGSSSTRCSPVPRPQRTVTVPSLGSGVTEMARPSHRSTTPSGKRRTGTKTSSGARPLAW